MDAVTQVLANELGPRKIRVNSINPGVVNTEGAVTQGVIGSDFEAGALSKTPLGTHRIACRHRAHRGVPGVG